MNWWKSREEARIGIAMDYGAVSQVAAPVAGDVGPELDAMLGKAWVGREITLGSGQIGSARLLPSVVALGSCSQWRALFCKGGPNTGAVERASQGSVRQRGAGLRGGLVDGKHAGNERDAPTSTLPQSQMHQPTDLPCAPCLDATARPYISPPANF